jgi:hypothetical protein
LDRRVPQKRNPVAEFSNVHHGEPGKKTPTGVEKRGKRYRAKANHKGKTIHLGTFDKEEDAVLAYQSFVYSIDKSTKYIE